jgi:outer membrane receptor protein involved in Fe transport
MTRIPVARSGASLLVVALFASTPAPARAQTQQTTPASQPPAPAPQFNAAITVVGVTPLPGLGVPVSRLPNNVQVATAGDLARTPGIHVGAQLGGALASVHLNEAQSSTFQPDVQFRGFAASPLLGLPQGLAVYQDGVRVNEPFGDTVNWDVLPTNAVASIAMMPGSNPLFGLNALGGALSLQTKTGFSHPGHAARVSTGSFGRQWAELESGGNAGTVAYFAAARFLQEDGWRDFSPSRVTQVFGNVSWQSERSRLAATVTASTNRLIGNGPAPVQLLLEDRRQVFTHPDETATDVGLFTVSGRRQVRRGFELEGVAYYRPATVGTFNGDDTPYDECESRVLRELLCHEDGEGSPVLDRTGRPVAHDDDNPLNATNNSSSTRSRGWGGTAQATVTQPLGGRDNHFVGGASVDGAQSRYTSQTELASLTGDRGTVGTGVFDQEADVRLRTTVRHVAAFAGDFFSLAPRVTVSGSTRLTHSTIRLRDQLGIDLNGDHTFTALNAAGGAAFDITPGALTLFGGLSRSSRVPTPSELSCADPDDPCRLPNAFLSDPPLEMVVAHTWEGGARGIWEGVSWAASLFTTGNRDDILFVSSGPLTNHGHFENVGDTRRKGLELTAAGGSGRSGIQWRGAYTYLRATFASPLVLGSPNHPDAVDGEIRVDAGATIPSVPRHLAKADVLVPMGKLDLAASVSRMSSQFLRGDEANLLAPIDPATIVNLGAGYRLGRGVTLMARVTNLFDTRPSSFGVLGEADDVLGDEFDDPRFLSPTAPRAAWFGIELRPR